MKDNDQWFSVGGMRERKESQVAKTLNGPLHVPWLFIPLLRESLEGKGYKYAELCSLYPLCL